MDNNNAPPNGVVSHSTNNQPATSMSLVNWPGAFGLFKHSKAAVMVNLSTILGLSLISFAVFFVLELFLDEPLTTSVQFVVSPFFYAALVLTFLASIRGSRVSVGEKLSESPRYFINLILLRLLVGLSVFVGLLLFVIPGIILLAIAPATQIPDIL